jgi:hypothetical protein
MELVPLPSRFAFGSELQAAAHQRPLSRSGAFNLAEALDALFEGFDKETRQRYSLVYGKMLGLAQDILGEGKCDVLLVHVFTCNTRTGACQQTGERSDLFLLYFRAIPSRA